MVFVRIHCKHHDSAMREVKVNGQITEVKQPRPWSELRWVTIWACISVANPRVPVGGAWTS